MPTAAGVRPGRRRAAGPQPREKTVPFSIDAALLRELGERLVGRAHIALAELIKNSYDADATVVDVVIGTDAIVVRDNGNGMTFDEFRGLWMRIGSPHKERQSRSARFDRPVTGSKGVGRLAAQFLAHAMTLETVSVEEPDVMTVAEIDWDEALTRASLTQARASVRTVEADAEFAARSRHGTTVRMTDLKQDWDEAALRDLARELWPLQPPFDRPPEADELRDDKSHGEDAEGGEATNAGELTAERLLTELDDEAIAGTNDGESFRVRLRTPYAAEAHEFESQMRRVLDIWSAKITGRLVASKGGNDAMLEVEVTWPDEDEKRLDQALPGTPLHELDFEVRVFELHHRQRHRIPVNTAREYLKRNGGVHVYDAGFHLPYYGADTDWLNLERDHANRLTLSELLPADLNVTRGLNALPTNRRVYGVVDIDTARERRSTKPARRQRDALTIQVSRDRLVDNAAYRALVVAVRTAIDFYAVQETRRRNAQSAPAPDEPAPRKVERVREVLERHRSDIPRDAFDEIASEVDATLASVESEAERQAAQAGLLGALATAGISALAFEHEFNRQLGLIERLARKLRRNRAPDRVPELTKELEAVVSQARDSRRLFTHLLDPEDFERVRPRARALIDATVEQLAPFLRGVRVEDAEVPKDFRLPSGSVAEWTSLFQNVFVNAANAMLDSDERLIAVSAERVRGRAYVRVQDTGVGIDLERADELFEPFSREQRVSDDRRELGFGGTGLGLTIVRMLAARNGCDVYFVQPDDGFATALELSWRAR